MATWCICSSLSILVVYTILSLCSYEAVGETDKYRDIHKRIFCNMAGCGNMVHGKRDYVKTKLYNMFNRPSTGKRSQSNMIESPTTDDKEYLTSHDLQQPYANWLQDNYDSMDSNLPGSEYEDTNVNYLPNELSQLVSDRAQYTLNEKYRLLKAAEYLLHYVNSVAREKIQKKKSTAHQTQDFSSDWSEIRK